MRTTAGLFILLGLFFSRATAQNRADGYRLINEGSVLLGRFKPVEALDRYNEALEIADKVSDNNMYAMALFGAGQAVWYKGNFNGAADTMRKALQVFRQNDDQANTGGALRILSNIYDDLGDYENAFRAVREALELYKDYHDDNNEVLSIVQMGKLYTNTGDYDRAMKYFNSALDKKPGRGEYPYRELHHSLGNLYADRGMLDSARYFYRKAFTGNPRSKIIRLRIGDTYLTENNTDSAFYYLAPLMKEATVTSDVNILIGAGLGMGKVYLLRKDFPAAMEMAQSALDMSAQRGARQTKRDAYQLLSAIYEAQGDGLKALDYQKRYEKIKDSVISDRFKGQLYAFRQKAEESEQLAALREEKKLAQRTLLIICLAAVFLIALLMLRHKNEKLHLKQRASELEMQALRAQMNPHFIFNCLSAINHFILNNETDRASEYLTRFSRLLRMVLINAGKPIISLEEELSMLRIYLDMEQLRFKDAFEYYIYSDPAVHPSMTNVPSFILQPFCENAIWHGLLHKEGKGQLNIHFKMEGDTLICTVRDNGIGRQKAAELKTSSVEKQRSFGHKLSAERLALFNGSNGKQASFTIEDIRNNQKEVTGTVVVIKIKQSGSI
ncbi:MAG: tetratricopeptide repeat protein [Bacteroidetes bacterium]|nr:tetratricopeptide repeat protein [Bacteroidota bacterium]